MKMLRAQILASTFLAGSMLLSTAAQAQDVAPPAGEDAVNPAEQPPSGPPEAQPTPSVSSEGESVDTGQDIVVTGSRLPQPNLESAAPITVVTDQDVKLSGTTRIEDMLNSLPQVGASMASGTSNGASGAAEVDLRYFGSKRALVLINGRRLMPGDPVDNTQAADVNNIPAALIKRVEVLTGGASSVYGADAVTGVVNFIMDTNFEGVRFDGNYSFYQHNNDDPKVGGGLRMSDILDERGFPYPTGSVTDGHGFDGTVSIGAGFDDGRGHAVGYFGYRKLKPVLQADRDYSACTIQNRATGVPRCGGSATAAPGTAVIFAPTEDGAFTSTVAALGPGTITPFVQNIYNFGPLNHYMRPDERYIGGVFANYEIDESFEPYLEFMFMDDRTLAQIAPSGDFGNTFTINCDNPFMSAEQRAIICANPNLINGFIGSFPTAVAAGYNPNPGAPPINFIDPATGATYNQAFFQLLRRNVEGGPRISDLKHMSFRGVLGMRGDLSNVFSYDTYFQYGRTNYTQVFLNDMSAARIRRALNVIDDPRTPGVVDPICRSVLDGTDTACRPWDVFGPAGPSADAVDYLNVSGLIDGRTSQQVANFNVTGALGEMGVRTPWAEDGVGVNVGVEYRKESLELRPDALFQAGDLTGQGSATLPVEGSYRVLEAFAEAQLPIVQNNFIDDLTIGLGYRRSGYNLSNGREYSTNTYKIAAELAPVRDIRFRGALNRAVRAPNIQELFAPPFVALDGTKDPCADKVITPTDYGCIASGLPVGRSTPTNPAGQYNGLVGGNPDLRPEKGTTKTLGVVLQPRFLPKFALTVDYFDISLKDAIQGYGSDTIVTACVTQSTATFTSPACSLIHRDPSGSLWLVPGGQEGAGFVHNLPNNVGKVDSDGFDFNASYSHRIGFLGNLSASFIGTYTRKYEVDNGLTEVYDCAGLYGPVCSGNSVASSAPIPKWRHKLRTTLQTPMGLGVSLQWRRIGKVRAETLEDNESIGGGFNFDPGLRIKAQDYFDLAATYTLLDRINLRAGVNNLFDRNPPLVTSGSGAREGSNLCPSGPCNGNTFPNTWDALGRYVFMGATIDFLPSRRAPVEEAAPPPPPPPPPPPAAPATQTCPDGTVILATEACPAPPTAPPPPPPAPERG